VHIPNGILIGSTVLALQLTQVTYRLVTCVTIGRILKLIHTAATPNMTKLSCLCRVRFGGVNWIPDNSKTVADRKFEV